MSERDVYIAIMVASANGRGLHLTPQECDDLSLDDAIATRAANGLEADEYKPFISIYDDFAWAKIKVQKARKPANSVTGDHSHE